MHESGEHHYKSKQLNSQDVIEKIGLLKDFNGYKLISACPYSKKYFSKKFYKENINDVFYINLSLCEDIFVVVSGICSKEYEKNY